MLAASESWLRSRTTGVQPLSVREAERRLVAAGFSLIGVRQSLPVMAGIAPEQSRRTPADQACGRRIPLIAARVFRSRVGGRMGSGAAACIDRRDWTTCGSQSALPTSSTSTSGSNGLRR